MTWSSYGAMLNGQNTNLTDLKQYCSQISFSKPYGYAIRY